MAEQPVRILQVVTVMNRGGLETMLMNYYRRLDRSEVQFDFMVHRAEPGHYDGEIEALGGRIFRMPPIKPGGYRRYFGLLDRFFAEHPEYRVVHSHINENSSFVLRAAKRAGVPCRIAHSHLSDLGLDLKLPFRLYARLSMGDNPNRYFACSRKAGEWLFGRRTAGERLVVLNNAVNVEQFAFDPEARRDVRRELGVNDGLVVGHIGRFNEQKNHAFLIDVFAALRAGRPDARLVLVGDGKLREAVREKVERLGLTEAVVFTGIRTDIARLMQGFDLFLFPSLFEGLPVVLVEAQASGLKCIVSDAVTREADVTGRVEFVSLREPPARWAERVLTAPLGRADTSAALRRQGYDTATMSAWLADYYRQQLALAGGQ